MTTRRQECIKRLAGKCHLCEETSYDVLDAHRILPGASGGKYHKNNTICICANCHRKVHSGEIVILGRHPSTRGDLVLHIMRDGKEEWIHEPSIIRDEADNSYSLTVKVHLPDKT